MTEQEIINQNIQRQIDAQNARIDNVLTKVDMLVTESQQQREDIRRTQEKHDANMKEIRGEIRDALKNLQNLTVAAVVGITAIAVGVLGFLWTTARDMNPQPPASPTQATQYQK